MPPAEDSNQAGSNPQLRGNEEFAQAFKDLARGEQTANALENQLSAIEKKIDELLAQANQQQREVDALGDAALKDKENGRSQ